MILPFAMVIFGATGDLVQKKIIPSLFSLFKDKELPEQFFIIGFARREYTAEAFASYFPQYASDPAWKDFASHILYQQGVFEDEKGYRELIDRLQKIDETVGECVTRIFYLATPPVNYLPILENLEKTKLSEGRISKSVRVPQQSSFAEATADLRDGRSWARIAIEKPFGKDVETAKMLDTKLSEIFEERQIFRVDHYLGKETVQNLLVFRFANSIFEPVWKSEFIDHVQITWMEKDGIGTRGNFFDGVGMLRDVAQNHLMQLFASVAMGMPKSFSREDVRDARTAAIQAIDCINPKDVPQTVVRGQYEGYTSEPMVTPNSQTDTFVAMKFFIKNEQFTGVPFYVRAGKAMAKNSISISLIFKQTCQILFKEIGCPEEGNILTINIQPDEGITFHIIAKKPGSKLALETVDMHFTYKEQFGTSGTDAYQRLLLDILGGDQMLFNRSDELASSWEFITNILEGWEQYHPQLFSYAQGTTGPKEADALIEKDGRKWL